MFILRRISGQGVQMNFCLGNSYTIVTRDHNYEDFCRSFKHIFDRNHVADLDDTADSDTKNCYAFVSSEGGGNLYPLWSNQKNYIMTENGKTFCNLTQK